MFLSMGSQHLVHHDPVAGLNGALHGMGRYAETLDHTPGGRVQRYTDQPDLQQGNKNGFQTM